MKFWRLYYYKPLYYNNQNHAQKKCRWRTLTRRNEFLLPGSGPLAARPPTDRWGPGDTQGIPAGGSRKSQGYTLGIDPGWNSCGGPGGMSGNTWGKRLGYGLWDVGEVDGVLLCFLFLYGKPVVFPFFLSGEPVGLRILLFGQRGRGRGGKPDGVSKKPCGNMEPSPNPKTFRLCAPWDALGCLGPQIGSVLCFVVVSELYDYSSCKVILMYHKHRLYYIPC